MMRQVVNFVHRNKTVISAILTLAAVVSAIVVAAVSGPGVAIACASIAAGVTLVKYAYDWCNDEWYSENVNYALDNAYRYFKDNIRGDEWASVNLQNGISRMLSIVNDSSFECFTDTEKRLVCAILLAKTYYDSKELLTMFEEFGFTRSQIRRIKNAMSNAPHMTLPSNKLSNIIDLIKNDILKNIMTQFLTRYAENMVQEARESILPTIPQAGDGPVQRTDMPHEQ